MNNKIRSLVFLVAGAIPAFFAGQKYAEYNRTYDSQLSSLKADYKNADSECFTYATIQDEHDNTLYRCNVIDSAQIYASDASYPTYSIFTLAMKRASQKFLDDLASDEETKK